MKRFLLGLVCFLLVSVPLFSWQWPFENAFLTLFSDFASVEKSFQPGLWIEGAGQELKMPQKGSLVFETGKTLSLRSGGLRFMNKAAVFTHDSGFTSILLGFKNFSVKLLEMAGELQNHVFDSKNLESDVLQEGESLGIAGERVFLSVVDSFQHRILNPWLIFPVESGLQAPGIQAFRLLNRTSNERIQGYSWMSVPQKDYDLYIKVENLSQFSRDFSQAVPEGNAESKISSLQSFEVSMDGTALYRCEFNGLDLDPDHGRLYLFDAEGKYQEAQQLDGYWFAGSLNLDKGNNRISLRFKGSSGEDRLQTIWIKALN